MCTSFSCISWIYSILDTGDKCKEIRCPSTMGLNSDSSLILSTYLLTGPIKCVKNTLFWIAQLTAESPHTAVGLQKPIGVCPQTLRVSHDDLTFLGCHQPRRISCCKVGLVAGALNLPGEFAACCEAPPQTAVWLPQGVLWCKYFKYNFEDFAIKNSLTWLRAQLTANYKGEECHILLASDRKESNTHF